jgi:hypothetical protein
MYETCVAPPALDILHILNPALARWANVWRTYGAYAAQDPNQFSAPAAKHNNEPGPPSRWLRGERTGLKTRHYRGDGEGLFSPLGNGQVALDKSEGVVKRHVEFARHEGSFFSSPERIFSLSCISTKARSLNPAVERWFHQPACLLLVWKQYESNLAPPSLGIRHFKNIY